jgi:prolyl-tRNA synthetase
MRWTQTFIPTLRERPVDAEVASHILMLRAGLIRKLSAGVYSYLPLGWRALEKVAAIVRAEMDRAGALETLLPIIQPVELWEETGRVKDYGDNLLKAVDRSGRVNILGPTHEEVITDLVRAHISSYRQLPVNFYQIQVKFRDETRPRFGVIRSREFLMKDAYSFNVDQQSLEETYRVMCEAYRRVFTRVGLKFAVVEADPGAIGGAVNHEFVVPTETGEDVIVSCPACGYAADIERAAAAGPQSAEPESAEPAGQAAAAKEAPAALTQVATPGMTTIDEVSAFLNVTPDRLIKTLVFLADGNVVLALVRGDHELNEIKLARVLGATTVTMADAETITRVTGAPVGFAGPVGLSATIVADPYVMALANAVAGANAADAHVVNVNPGRDFTPSQVADIRAARAGDPCPHCRKPLAVSHGTVVGHVYQLGTKYSAKMKALFLDEKGTTHPFVMGCYGIGISRTLAAAVETSRDDKGIIFPVTIAPYEVHLASLNTDDPEVVATAERLSRELGVAGAEVLYDDRDASPGVKFNDADLLGIPVRVTVGRRGLARGEVEVKLRREKEAQRVPLAQAVQRAVEVVTALKAELEPR